MKTIALKDINLLDVGNEIQIYGATYSAYRAEYDTLWPEGWRLYILQSFVAADGTVLYNAVWRQSTIDRPL